MRRRYSPPPSFLLGNIALALLVFGAVAQVVAGVLKLLGR